MGGAAPILLRFVFACRPRAGSVRRSCALLWVRRPVATPAGAGGGGRGGAQRAGPAAPPPPPPGVAVPSGGGGTPPLPRGGQRAGGGVGGERGGGAAVLHPPAPGGWSMALVPAPLGTPPGYTRSAGVARQPWALRAAWLAAGGSVWRMGGERSLCRGLPPPPSPGGHRGGPLRLRTPGCRRSARVHGAGAEPPVGSG